MALDFNDHLLETPDGLITSFLGHLLAEIVLGVLDCGVLSVPRLLLGLVWDVGTSLLLQVANSSPSTGLSTGLIVWLILGGIGTLVSSCIDVFAVEGLVLVVDITGLLLDALSRQLWNIMPSVVVGWLIDLAKFVFRRANFVGGVCGSITCHVT